MTDLPDSLRVASMALADAARTIEELEGELSATDEWVEKLKAEIAELERLIFVSPS